MEDITLEDQNYGTSFCRCHFEFCACSRIMMLPFEVEYETYPSMEWHPAKYEESVIRQLLKDQFPTFVNKVKTTDCQAELRRLLATGPPIYISDKHALPLPENGDTHICNLWFSSDNQERSAKLEGALEGEERQQLWNDLNQFLIKEGQEEGDIDGTVES
jgi:hypothetical protein